jgi:hypothetical protein
MDNTKQNPTLEELKQAEESLRKNQETLKQVLDTLKAKHIEEERIKGEARVKEIRDLEQRHVENARLKKENNEDQPQPLQAVDTRS